MTLVSNLRKAFRWTREDRQARKEAKAIAHVAKVFNERYYSKNSYAREGTRFIPKVTAGVEHGVPMNDGARRWMCPQCNKIHAPYAYSILVGLLYPPCCDRPAGDRSECY